MRAAWPALALTLSCCVGIESCRADSSTQDFPQRHCSQAFWVHAPSAARVELVGSWDGWSKAVPATKAGDGWYRAELRLPPGQHGYQVVVDGKPGLDETNALTTYHQDEEVSLRMVPDCSVPEIRVDQVVETDPSGLIVRARFLAASGGARLLPSSVRARTRDGRQLTVRQADSSTGAIIWLAEGLDRDKYTLTLEASDVEGRVAVPTRVSGWVHPQSADWRAGMLYHLMLDRYRGNGGTALAPPSAPGGRAGGTLDGVRAEVEKGTFALLGVTALWISPAYLSPDEERAGRDGHLYSGYHGYWPVDSRRVDPRIGGEAGLRDLVDTAHRQGIRVLLDLVPNHVYETNARYVEHRDAGWFHEGAEKCVCGESKCDWASHIESCWFTSYLPDFRFQRSEVMDLAADDAVWWAGQFDLDGIRIDAVPMMPRAVTRRIANALRTGWAPREAMLVLGEVYTGGGETGVGEIRYHMGPDGLDSAFDFPLMWAIRDAIAANRSGFDAVEATLHRMEVDLEGAGAILARIIGNHDTTRFLSEAQGDAGGDPWSSPPAQPADPFAYAKQRMAMVLVMSLPGMPVIYYGDETGLAGGGDPDCRRVMPAWEELSPERQSLLDAVRRMGRFRSCSAALQRGVRAALDVTRDTYVFLRDVGDGWPVLVALSKSATDEQILLEGNALPRGIYTDVVTGEQLSFGVSGGATAILLAPLSVRVLVAAGAPCVR